MPVLPLLWQIQANAGVGSFNLCVQHLEALEAGRRLASYGREAALHQLLNGGCVAFRQIHQEAQVLNWPLGEGVLQF